VFENSGANPELKMKVNKTLIDRLRRETTIMALEDENDEFMFLEALVPELIYEKANPI